MTLYRPKIDRNSSENSRVELHSIPRAADMVVAAGAPEQRPRRAAAAAANAAMDVLEQRGELA